MRKSSRKFEAAWVAGLAVLLIAAMVTLLVLQNPGPAQAIRALHNIVCLGYPVAFVNEGDSFEVGVSNRSQEGIPEHEKEPFEVYWSTTSGTAAERDYTALDRVRQDGTVFETWWARRMNKTFCTTDDEKTEGDETYAVWFEPVGPAYGWTSCPIIIKDDDGPGAKKTWIASTPEESWGYEVGETIRIKQQFTEAVVVNGSDLSIEIDLGERLYGTTRDADYASGSGTNTLTYEYDVKWFDIDKDGIGISDGRHDGEATIVTEDDSTEVNYNYEGIKTQPNQKVSGKPFVEDVNISSTPASGDTYRKGENIDIQVQFNRAVQVNGTVRVKAQIGEGVDALTNFPYSSGSGTDTLAFRHEVATDDSDPDGVALDDGDPDSDYFYYEFSGSGTVTENGGERW